MKLQATGGWNVMHHLAIDAFEAYRDGFLASSSLPNRDEFAIRPRNLRRRVIAPANSYRDVACFIWNQEAQAHRRRKVGLLCRLALIVRLLWKARRRRNDFNVIIFVGVRALLWGSTNWDQEPSQVPVRGTNPT